MNKIASFTVDHTTLSPGVYISRQDGDVVTYDIRTRKPNSGDYMDNPTMHSVEHLIATLLRNSAIADHIIYFGPMGCQTGFYLLVRGVPSPQVVEVLKTCFAAGAAFDGEMPGNSPVECGNYRTLDLEQAKAECAKIGALLSPLKDVLAYQ